MAARARNFAQSRSKFYDYASILLNAFNAHYAQNLCRHNRRKPNPNNLPMQLYNHAWPWIHACRQTGIIIGRQACIAIVGYL